MFPFSRMLEYGTEFVPKEIKKLVIADGAFQVGLLYSTGELYMYGVNRVGELGTGDNVAVPAWRLVAQDVKDVFVSPDLTMYIKNDNTIWGSGTFGAKVNGASGTIPPSRVFINLTQYYTSFNISDIKDIVLSGGSGNRGWYLLNNGDLWGCGSAQWGALGVGTDTGLFTTRLVTSNVETVISPQTLTWIKKTDGTYWRTGLNSYGTLIAAANTTQYNSFTQYVISGVTLSSMYVSYNNIFFINGDGTRLFVCGSNAVGQYGSGDTITSMTLANSGTFNNKGVHARMICQPSDRSTLVVTESGIYSCGLNVYGSLGIGNKTSTSSMTLSQGSITSQDSTEITFICGSPAGGTMYVHNNKLYGTGTASFLMKSTESTVFIEIDKPQ